MSKQLERVMALAAAHEHLRGFLNMVSADLCEHNRKHRQSKTHPDQFESIRIDFMKLSTRGIKTPVCFASRSAYLQTPSSPMRDIDAAAPFMYSWHLLA